MVEVPGILIGLEVEVSIGENRDSEVKEFYSISDWRTLSCQ